MKMSTLQDLQDFKIEEGLEVAIHPDSPYYNNDSDTNPKNTKGVVIKYSPEHYGVWVQWGQGCANRYNLSDLMLASELTAGTHSAITGSTQDTPPAHKIITELVPVSFKSKAELAQALISGRIFKAHTDSPDIIHYDAKKNNPFRIGNYLMDSIWNVYDSLYEVLEKPWYESIPKQGVLCWCWDNMPTKKRLRLVLSYSNTGMTGFHTSLAASSMYYRNAVPLTKEEVQKLMPDF